MADRLATLRARLARVEALHRRATSAGERLAAARARDRLLAHIGALRCADPVASFVAEHVASLGVPAAPPPPPVALPSAAEVSRALARWEAGALGAEALADWAAEFVDRVELPTDPDAPGAAVAEVLLQLSAQHATLAFDPADAPAIRDFLQTGDLRRWFALLAEVAGRRRARRSA